ncbi:MAG TPA: hypothetical protein VMG08_09825 [Allosphingosinicella sp.]|nr:hypothetical protein [Allosphingosinicella sp.]
MYFSIAGEDLLHLAVAEKIVAHFGCEVAASHNRNGCGRVDSGLRGFAAASTYSPWLVFRDLDAAPCAPALLEKILPERDEYPNLLLRIVVREVESWIIADRTNLAQFLGVSLTKIPLDPESLAHPKEAMILLANQTRHRKIRDGLVPRGGSGASVGPEYNSILEAYIWDKWSIEGAAANAPSLSRLLQRFQILLDK